MIHAIFDLDGTISDPAEGITKSINHALVSLGCDAQPTEALLQYIGPPLTRAFGDLLGDVSDDDISRAIAAYRERFGRIGYAENQLYPGIVTALETIQSRGHVLHIATSKRRDFARKVLAHLGIQELFTSVHGCDLDRTKGELVSGILAATNGPTAVMVGDRDSDFVAGHEVGIRCIGVSWGYGTSRELAEADLLVHQPADLPEAIESLRNQRVEPTR